MHSSLCNLIWWKVGLFPRFDATTSNEADGKICRAAVQCIKGAFPEEYESLPGEVVCLRFR